MNIVLLSEYLSFSYVFNFSISKTLLYLYFVISDRILQFYLLPIPDILIGISFILTTHMRPSHIHILTTTQLSTGWHRSIRKIQEEHYNMKLPLMADS